MKKVFGRRGDKTPVRRLKRSDVVKHNNADAASFSSSSEKSVSNSSLWSALMTRSQEFPDRTSFRNFRDEDEEMDPGDLSISIEAWEAYKKRHEFQSSNHEIHKYPVHDLNEAGPSGTAGSELTWSEASEIGSFRNLEDRVVLDGGSREENEHGLQTKTINVMSRGYLVPNRSDVVAVVGGGGGGIEGVSPLVLKLPPAKRPPLEHHGSSWDFLTHFAPAGEIVRRPSFSSSSEGEEVEREARLLESADTANKACSFTRNEGGDSSSTLSNTSPVYANGGSIITSWQKGGLLGRGSFASVYEGISGDGNFFAVKEVSLLVQGSQTRECIQQLEREIALLSQLQHQNIVRYLGTAKDGSNLYIFLELVTQGSLEILYQKYQLPESVVSTYTRQILDGLKYLHGEGIIHRDIKCANILVDANGAVKLADFGIAEEPKFNDVKSCKGTPFWMAPEVINPKGTDGYGSSADIWSLGCTVLEMLTRQVPYCDPENNPFRVLYKIGRGELPNIPDILSQGARDFIVKCLKVNPEERPTAAELLNHLFVERPLASSGSGISGYQLLHRRG